MPRKYSYETKSIIELMKCSLKLDSILDFFGKKDTKLSSSMLTIFYPQFIYFTYTQNRVLNNLARVIFHYFSADFSCGKPEN